MWSFQKMSVSWLLTKSFHRNSNVGCLQGYIKTSLFSYLLSRSLAVFGVFMHCNRASSL